MEWLPLFPFYAPGGLGGVFASQGFCGRAKVAQRILEAGIVAFEVHGPVFAMAAGVAEVVAEFPLLFSRILIGLGLRGGGGDGDFPSDFRALDDAAADFPE